jgi:cellulose synthase/poly-beta-1,6-N-acetylglucosamine synthase-like glycosyltransferase
LREGEREKAPAVTVVVPVRNCEKTIGKTLDALGRIDYPGEKLEVIVVDGISSDRTKEIVQQYPVKMLTQRTEGLNQARNTGLENSTGEIIAYTDGDCVVSSKWLRKIVANFDDPEVGAVGGNVEGYRKDNLFAQYADNSVIRVMPFSSRRVTLDHLKPFLYAPGCNMAFRRSALEKAGLFNPNIRNGFDEFETLERIIKSGFKIVFDPEVLVQHQHRSSLREIMKQAFNYGTGGALLLKMLPESVLGKWLRACLYGFIVYILMVASLSSLLILTGNLLYLVLILGLLLFHVPILIIYYSGKGMSPRSFRRILAFPIIDFLRTFSFCLGEAYAWFFFKADPTTVQTIPGFRAA